jgi:hypothetical protein
MCAYLPVLRRDEADAGEIDLARLHHDELLAGLQGVGTDESTIFPMYTAEA